MDPKPKSAIDLVRRLAQHVEKARQLHLLQNEADEERRMLSESLTERFPQLTEATFPMPNALARNSLFSAVKDGERKDYKNEKLYSQSQYNLIYSGQQLNQSDLDVLMAVIYTCAADRFTVKAYFSAYRLIKILGWTMSQQSYRRLRQALIRLKQANLTIEVLRKDRQPLRWYGNFIDEATENDMRVEPSSKNIERVAWGVRLNPRLTLLFSKDDVTFGIWYIRRKLDGRMPLAQWLHTFYSTHEHPIALHYERIKEMSGSRQKNISAFKERLDKALAKLVAIGFLRDAPGKNRVLPSGMVEVERVPPAELARKAREEFARVANGRAPRYLRDLATQLEPDHTTPQAVTHP